ncbi:MAG: hypothetical protein WBA43_08575, partial [Elainellaceae cyanobacterium]
PRGSAANFIIDGIRHVNPEFPYEEILDEVTAVNTAVDAAPSGSLVVILPETVSRAIQLIDQRRPITESTELQRSPQQMTEHTASDPAATSTAESDPSVQSSTDYVPSNSSL